MLILDHIKRRSPYVAAVLQVSILNGTDLKAMINYTGEQVSQRVTALCTESFFMLQFLCSIAWLIMRALNFLGQCKQK